MTAAETDPLLPFTGRWTIVIRPAGLNVWTAEWASEDRRSIRYIVARSAAELAAKLQAVELAEP
ncbi:MAG TPA: hypothetical protein VMI33_10425 [Streptosporangiaceae bacterium]|nr:hypothetical protein [Streptosporangiaceae bacterium]